MDTDVIPIEQLLEHRAWVRTLARRLVFDESQVDDVEQQTWLAAMERPPRRGSARAWLGAVVRNVSSKLRRKEARLTDRHERRPQPGPVPPTGDVVEQAELHRDVVEAVLALEEPYRTTLLFRYFDGLPPREIAREMAVPVETVRVRTRRGLEKIRKGFDDKHGSRRAWHLALVPLTGFDPVTLATQAGAASATTVGTGVLVMSTQAKIALVAAAVLLVVGLVVWNPFAAEPETPPIVTDGDGDTEPSADTDPGLEGREVEVAMEPDPEPDDQPAPIVAPGGPWIEVVRKAEGKTTRAKALAATFVDRNGTRHEVTGTNGVLAVPTEVEGAATLWLTTVDDGGFYRFDEQEYPDGRSELIVAPPARVELRFRTENALLDKAEVDRRYAEAGHGFAARWVAEGLFTKVDPIRSRVDSRLHEVWLTTVEGRWDGDAFRILNTPTGGTWRLLVSRAGGTPWLVSVPKLEPGASATVEVTLPANPSLQRVRVVDVDSGEPLVGATVTPYYEHGDDEAFFEGVARTVDERGEVWIPISDNAPGVRPPSWLVETTTHIGTLLQSEMQIDPNNASVFPVSPKGTIKGIAYTKSGELATKGLVVSGSKGRMAITKVGPDGRFELGSVEVGSMYRGMQRARGLTVVFVEDLENMVISMEKVQIEPGETVTLQLGDPNAAGTTGVIEGRLTAGGEPVPEQFVIVKGADDTTKGGFAKTDADGRYRHEGLTAGVIEFRIYLGNPSVVDDFWIRTGSDTDEATATIVLQAGETRTLDFDLPGGRLRVRVVDEDDKPIQGAVVFARPTGEARAPDADRFQGFEYSMGWANLTNEQGVVEIIGVEPNIPLRLEGGQRETGWRFERDDVRASADGDVPEIVITRSDVKVK